MWAIVTGASSGIGQSIAIYLSNQGYDIILVARNKARLEQTALQLRTKSKIEVVNIDNRKEVLAFCEKYTLDKKVTLLVNNAGYGTFGNFETISLEEELKMLDVNVRGLFILTKVFFQTFLKNNRGQIINIASIAGIGTTPLMATYGATKAFVRSLTMSLRAEQRHTHPKSLVRVRVISPGPIRTNFFKLIKSKQMYSDELMGTTNKISLDVNYFVKKAMRRALKGRKTEIVVGKLSRLLHYVEGTNKFIPERLKNWIYFKGISNK